MRVVSLLPSATELLCAIGGDAMLVGRSHECDHPASIVDRPALTAQRTCASTSAEIDQEVRASLRAHDSLYTLDLDQLVALRPEVILTQDLCDVCSIDLRTVRDIARSIEPTPRVISLNPTSLEDVFDDMLRIGDAVGLHRPAQRAMVALRGRYWESRDYVNPYLDGPAVAFLEWMNPIFVGGHWTPQLIEDAGGRHALNPRGARSREVTSEALVSAAPSYLIVCPCGYTIDQTMRELDALRGQAWWGTLPAVREGRVAVVDGSAMFNRPGPRLVDAHAWLVSWLNDRPALRPDDFPVLELDDER